MLRPDWSASQPFALPRHVPSNQGPERDDARPLLVVTGSPYLDLHWFDWFSNAKLKATGYRLLYPDARIGLKDTIDWYRLHGWL
jgi:hypothetical protein